MIIFALIFLGPDKIPQFLKSCAEGIVLFKKTINNNEISDEKKEASHNSKNKKNNISNSNKFKKNKKNSKNHKFNPVNHK